MPEIRAELFGSPLSPFVRKVERALRLKKVDYELVEPRRPGDLKRWNPQTGKMPAIKLGSEALYDSTFILRRLDALRPAPALLSRDPRIAASQRLLEDWADESLYWHVIALRFTPGTTRASIEQITAGMPAFLRPLMGLFIRRQSGAPVAQGFGRLPEDVLLRELALRLDDLVASLGESPFFFADEPSAADLAVHAMLEVLSSGPTPNAAAAIDARPPLRDWMRRVEEQTGL